MTFRQSVKTILKYQGLVDLLGWLWPIKRVWNLKRQRWQWFVMRPYWRAGHFGWISINRWRE